MNQRAEAIYASIAVIGKGTPELWFYAKWAPIAAALDPLVATVGDAIAVRTVQGDESNKDVRFGRLTWNEASHRKWAHKSPDNAVASSRWTFMLGEILAPSWNVCQRENCAPNLFISLENPHIVAPAKDGQFTQFFHLALPAPFYQERRALVASIVQQIAKLMDSVLLIIRFAPWKARGDSVQNTLNNHLHYVGMQNDMIPDLGKTQSSILPTGLNPEGERWAVFDP